VINNCWRADPVDGTGREDQKRGDKEPRPVEITNDELRGFIDRAGVVDQTGAESLVVIMRRLRKSRRRWREVTTSPATWTNTASQLISLGSNPLRSSEPGTKIKSATRRSSEH
jgi:hypothetical protein